jgi:hypothetical protein
MIVTVAKHWATSELRVETSLAAGPFPVRLKKQDVAQGYGWDDADKQLREAVN